MWGSFRKPQPAPLEVSPEDTNDDGLCKLKNSSLYSSFVSDRKHVLVTPYM